MLVVGAIGCVGLIADIPWAMSVVAAVTLLSIPVRIVQAWALLIAALPAEVVAPVAKGPLPSTHKRS